MSLSLEGQHRCSGCGHRWDGSLTGAELCGDCWRRVQAVALDAKTKPAPSVDLVVDIRQGMRHHHSVIANPGTLTLFNRLVEMLANGLP